MSNLLVVVFDNVGDARAARQAIGTLGQLAVVDAAVVTRDAEGKVDVDNELESSTRTGALVGTFLGALLFLFFPVVGMVLGAIGGGLVGKLIEPGVDQGFVREVTGALKPGGSALFVMFNTRAANDMEVLLAALRPFRGTVYQTTLPPEAEESLRRALE
jgi:uncharacterized membrane protein